MAGVVFTMNTYSSQVSLDFTKGLEFKELDFMVPQGSTLEVEGIQPEGNIKFFGNQPFTRYRVTKDFLVKSGQVVVKGVPLGRLRLWQLGIGFALLLILVSLTLTLRTFSLDKE